VLNSFLGSSIVINELKKLSPPNVAVVFFYFNYASREDITFDKLAAALTKQLAQIRLTTSSAETLDAHKAKQTRPSLDELFVVLRDEIETYTRVLFVFDALDESPERFQTRLLQDLEQKLPNNASMMFTSRDLPEIALGFQGRRRLDVFARDADMRSYITARISAGRGSRFHRIVAKAPSLEGEIVDKVIAKARGM
jgi:ATP/maltotriose-dependent transcriptional regulator MalT